LAGETKLAVKLWQEKQLVQKISDKTLVGKIGGEKNWCEKQLV
jgi:hypothetical protein